MPHFLRRLNTVRRIYRKQGFAGLGRFLSGQPEEEPAPPIVDISTSFVNWLCYANAGMLERGNLYCFKHAIDNLPSDAPIVEIGSFCGLSTNLITHYKQEAGVKNPLFTCDRWDFERPPDEQALGGTSSITHEEYRVFVKETFLRNIRMFSRYDLPHTIELYSDEFFQAWREGKEVQDLLGRPIRLGGPISFCYIDGNHTYDFARRDFENANEFLVSGGFILFDDSAKGSGWQVCKVVEEVENAGDYELVVRNPNCLFRKK